MSSTIQQADPTIFVIFGGVGDLSKRKLVPALYNLFLDGHLPPNFKIVILDKENWKLSDLQHHLLEGVNAFSRSGKAKVAQWKNFSAHLAFVQGDFTQSSTYAQLRKQIKDIEKRWNLTSQHVFYLATPPFLFGPISQALGEAGLSANKDKTRLVVEKPFGYDLESAKALNFKLKAHFDENQIFRIDHYLGKETVQNILAFRFANPMFEPIWNRRYIDHITITVAEEVGVEKRGGYYEKAGALRDMIQNHLMQLLCLVAMEPPVSFGADEIRNKKVDVLHAIRPLTHDRVNKYAVRGQYGSGWINGKQVAGYRDELGISPESTTETYAALKLYVDNWRWQDVPFYLRTGKRLCDQLSEISIVFRAVPHRSFPEESTLNWQPARLVICIQPQETIVLKFLAKQPGPHFYLRPVDMRFSYEEMFKTISADAYEALLWDLITNDSTLFMRSDQVETAWKILTPILDVWSTTPPGNFPNYTAGTWGPEEAEVLLAKDGYTWLNPIIVEENKIKMSIVKKS